MKNVTESKSIFSWTLWKFVWNPFHSISNGWLTRHVEWWDAVLAHSVRVSPCPPSTQSCYEVSPVVRLPRPSRSCHSRRPNNVTRLNARSRDEVLNADASQTGTDWEPGSYITETKWLNPCTHFSQEKYALKNGALLRSSSHTSLTKSMCKIGGNVGFQITKPPFPLNPRFTGSWPSNPYQDLFT